MRIEALRVNYHISTRELPFVLSVKENIRRAGYDGPIEVVGSRLEGSRISITAYASECRQELSPEEYVIWLHNLNELARKHDLSAGNIKEISKYLPKNAPQAIRFLVNPKNTWLHLDSDLDLVVKRKIRGIQDRYNDALPPKGSGLTIDVFVPENEGYVHLPNVLDF